MDKLKALLAKYDISQSWLAKEVEVSTTAISQLLNHNIWPKRGAPELKHRIHDALTSCNVFLHEIAEALVEPSAQTPKPSQPTIKEEELMLLRKQTLSIEARKQFGLPFNPFAGDIQSANELYLSKDFRYVRESMFQTARHGGFIAVVSESGGGKTTLKNDLYDRIARENLSIIVIEPYMLAAEDNDIKGKTIKSQHISEAILHAIAPSMSPKRSPEYRSRQIHDQLKESNRAGNQHVLIIDEAHCLPTPTLKHLKRFFELKLGYAQLLSIILIGQTELALKLSEQNQA